MHFALAPECVRIGADLYHIELAPVELEDAKTDEEKQKAAEEIIKMKAAVLPQPTEEDIEDIDVHAEVAPPRKIKTPMAPTPEEKRSMN